ncbi:phosphatidylinositol transfer protein 3-like isoform X1 [Dendrobium catenatum]|uniref:Patellin-6 n=2 Tax=Dendrobium catenatum TaxID=906689 RepID=A0A2I0VST7_9ASPA|nr:phosphatidylinositol transfer protein 3-like isoform X1 [Dendrobium catenatum]PKU66468.1 Patellin-6 [Dendrobium catenatum]
MSLKKSKSSRAEKVLSVAEQQQKINEVRKLIAPLSDDLPDFCSDASISRFLRARNWNSEKSSKMLKETLKWRLQYRPEMIRWEDVADEAKTGKIYRADYQDKFGRPVLVMRPGFQNTNSVKGQIQYLVYCMENAILNLPSDQEQMVWLIDFQDWTKASVSLKATRETAHVLQGYYPERLAVGILYNPSKIFEPFWKMVKPFLEQKTYKKVKFVYSDNPESQKVMLDLFDMDKLESAFGGRNQNGFDVLNFANRMKEDDKKMNALLSSGGSVLCPDQPVASAPRRSISSLSDARSEDSSEASSSSPKSGSNGKLEKEDVNGNLGCKSSDVDEPPLRIEDIQIKESI